jgi:hypothetical protein
LVGNSALRQSLPANRVWDGARTVDVMLFDARQELVREKARGQQWRETLSSEAVAALNFVKPALPQACQNCARRIAG